MKRNRYTISKKVYRNMHKAFLDFMHEISAKETSGAFYVYRLETPLGFLLINAPSADYGTIFCRFDEPEKARDRLALSCNPFTGKWNFHPAKGTADEMLASFIHNVRTVLMTPT